MVEVKNAQITHKLFSFLRLSPVKLIGGKMKQDKSNNFGIGEYAVMCCGQLTCIRHKKFKRCSRCGKVLKDERETEMVISSDKT